MPWADTLPLDLAAMTVKTTNSTSRRVNRKPINATYIHRIWCCSFSNNKIPMAMLITAKRQTAVISTHATCYMLLRIIRAGSHASL